MTSGEGKQLEELMQPHEGPLGKCPVEILHRCWVTCPPPFGQERKAEAGRMEEEQGENHLSVCLGVTFIHQSV